MIEPRPRIDPEAGLLDVVQASRSVIALLEQFSPQTEAQRQVDPRAIAAIREAGLARMLAPKQFGGYELPISYHIRSCIELAHGCAAASWVHMVCAAHTFVVGRFPQECQAEVFAESPDVLIPGALAPQGRTRKVSGGWVLDGRWQFGSGVEHGPWLLMGAMTEDGDEQSTAPAVHLVVPASDLSVDDTWYTLGMRGTGSNDLIAQGVFVPEHRAMPTRELFRGDFEGTAGPLYRLPVMGGLASMVAGTIVGIAQRGLTQFVDVTKVRDDVYTGASKASKPGIQMRVAESIGEVELAELLVTKNCALLDEAMTKGIHPLEMETTASIRWNAAYAGELCRRATDRVYAGAGANATRDDSPLQRWFRDINTACHHAIVDFDAIREARGRMALGLSPGVPL
ncbi:MAG: alkylation response protein AidB-like acyl-CoA dehydrogenase [Gammaproteobacteria bacterium]|jgi:alkylation response protein AidB-like acyl-CoA dehydrogenase